MLENNIYDLMEDIRIHYSPVLPLSLEMSEKFLSKEALQTEVKYYIEKKVSDSIYQKKGKCYQNYLETKCFLEKFIDDKSKLATESKKRLVMEIFKHGNTYSTVKGLMFNKLSYEYLRDQLPSRIFNGIKCEYIHPELNNLNIEMPDFYLNSIDGKHILIYNQVSFNNGGAQGVRAKSYVEKDMKNIVWINNIIEPLPLYLCNNIRSKKKVSKIDQVAIIGYQKKNIVMLPQLPRIIYDNYYKTNN